MKADFDDDTESVGEVEPVVELKSVLGIKLEDEPELVEVQELTRKFEDDVDDCKL